jgi:hypothetical protein
VGAESVGDELDWDGCEPDEDEDWKVYLFFIIIRNKNRYLKPTSRVRL